MHKVIVVGHVDHGKSTLLGRLLSDTGQIKQDKIERVRNICSAKGIALNPAFFLDTLEEEQAQGISIDTTSVNFEYRTKNYCLLDAPGHLEFLKNMASAASHADCAVLVIDVQEGIQEQTRRHLQILRAIGTTQIILALNKMDSVDYKQEPFEKTARLAMEIIESLNLECVIAIPIAAFTGENMIQSSEHLGWYQGPTLLEAIHELSIKMDETNAGEGNDLSDALPMRLILQDVYKFGDERFLLGRVISGQVEPGMKVCFSPSGKLATIESLSKNSSNQNPSYAFPGDSIAFKVAEPIFLERGELMSLPHQLPQVDTRILAQIAWLSSKSFDPNRSYLLKLGCKQTSCTIQVQDSCSISSSNSTGQNLISPGESMEIGDVKLVLLQTNSPIAFDRNAERNALNKLVICDETETLAAGMVHPQISELRSITINPNVQQEWGFVERKERESRLSHRAAVVWLTGLAGAGKTSLARALERNLFERGCNTFVVDADNMRHGLCADLGFSPEDRSENVRRLAHTARLLMMNGAICIVAAISPYEQDRQMAASIIGQEDFLEIFVFCPLELCQQRDPKGLYKRFASGQIKSLTGLDLPYQPPQNPTLRIDTSTTDITSSVELLIAALKDKGVISES